MIKKLFLMMLALAAGAMVNAQELNQYQEYMEVPNVQINENGEGQVDVYFNTTSDRVDGMQLRITLPEGLTIKKNSRGNYAFTFYNGDDAMTYDHGGTAMYHETEDEGNFYQMVLDSPSHTSMLPGYGLLFSFTVVADDTFVAPAEARFWEIIVGGNIDEPVSRYCPDVTFTITPFGYTSINGITSDAQEDTIYDISLIHI